MRSPVRRLPLGAAALFVAACSSGSGASPSAGADGSSPGPPSAAVTLAPTAAPSIPASTLVPAGTWASIATTGASPAAREDHTMTVADDGTVWVFGGRDGAAVFGDLWALDLAAGGWQAHSPAGDAPASRFGHEAVWVPGRGLVVFAGQAAPDKFFNDLWLYDPAADRWTLLPASGSVPVARYGTCAGVGPDGRLWISHGFTEDGVRFADTHAYDFATATWSDQAPSSAGPIERCLHTCWWRSDGTFALYGGQTTGVAALGDLWTLTPGAGGAATNSWQEVGGDHPPARNLPAVARHGQATIIIGGRGTERTALADAWQVPDATAVFSPLDIVAGPGPGARWGASLIDDPTGDGLFLFGGTNGDHAFGDVWALGWQ